jgi:hypothetical protein
MATAAFPNSTPFTPLSSQFNLRSESMAIAETAARKLLHGGSGAAVARGAATGTLGFGLDGLWQLIGGFFANIFAGAAHLLALPFEAIWHLLVAAVTTVAGAISSGIGDLWQLVAGFFPYLVAVLSGAAREIATQLEAFWQWVQSAAAAALPYVLAAAALLLVAALVFYFVSAICAATVAACRALVVAVCYLGHGLFFVGACAARALSFILPSCVQCCAVVTMKAPGAAGRLISRTAFEAAPRLYFLILRAGGAVVATAVFCARPVAWAVAAPVAFLFRVSVRG